MSNWSRLPQSLFPKLSYHQLHIRFGLSLAFCLNDNPALVERSVYCSFRTDRNSAQEGLHARDVGATIIIANKAQTTEQYCFLCFHCTVASLVGVRNPPPLWIFLWNFSLPMPEQYSVYCLVPIKTLECAYYRSSNSKESDTYIQSAVQRCKLQAEFWHPLVASVEVWSASSYHSQTSMRAYQGHFNVHYPDTTERLDPW